MALYAVIGSLKHLVVLFFTKKDVWFEQIFIEGVHTSSKTTLFANPLTRLDINNISWRTPQKDVWNLWYIHKCSHITCKLYSPNRPVSLLLRFHRALTARLATHSNVESPIKRLKIPNSTSKDPAPAVQVSLMLSAGTPVFKFTFVEDTREWKCWLHFQSTIEQGMINRFLIHDQNRHPHPGVRNSRAGVLKGWQQADS